LIRLWKKSDNTFTRPIGVKDAFVEKGFNAFYDFTGTAVEHVERDWARIEQIAFPAIEAAEAGEQSEETDAAVKAIAAMHFARSYGHRDASEAFFSAYQVAGFELDVDAVNRDAFVLQFGRAPRSGEIAREVSRRVEWIRHSRILFVGGMARIYVQALAILEPLHIEVLRPKSRVFGFVTGDTPLVLASGWHVGTRGGVGLADVEMAYIPLSRWLAVSFTRERQEEKLLSPMLVQKLNWQMWRSCRERLAFHPDEDFPRALGLSRPDGWPPDPTTTTP